MTSPPYKPKLGAPLTEANAPASAVTIVPEQDDLEEEWGTRRVSLGVHRDLDAAHVVDGYAQGLILHLSQSVIDGVRADGEGDQRELGARALLAPGRASSNRNYKSGELALGIKRGPITSDGRTASCVVSGPDSRRHHIANEAKRGVLIIVNTGAAAEAGRAGARAAIAAIMTGRSIETKDETEVSAKEADK